MKVYSWKSMICSSNDTWHLYYSVLATIVKEARSITHVIHMEKETICRQILACISRNQWQLWVPLECCSVRNPAAHAEYSACFISNSAFAGCRVTTTTLCYSIYFFFLIHLFMSAFSAEDDLTASIVLITQGNVLDSTDLIPQDPTQ